MQPLLLVREQELSFFTIFSQILPAPVFGATPSAESGSVLMAMAGPSEAIKAVAPFGKGVIARDVMVVSDQPEKASLLKTLGLD